MSADTLPMPADDEVAAELDDLLAIASAVGLVDEPAPMQKIAYDPATGALVRIPEHARTVRS